MVQAQSPTARGSLLERRDELERIEDAIERASDGAGEMMLIEGPAGIGKSALLEAGAELAAERGLEVLGARATELEREFPFGAVSQLLEPPLRSAEPREAAELLAGSAAHAVPVVGMAEARPPAAEGGFATLHGLYWLVANLAERAPLLLCLDDAHWADRDSLRFLAFLGPRLPDLPALLLCAARPEEWEAPAPLAGTASDPAARPIVPAPLSAQASAELLASRFGAPAAPAFVAACHAASAGNPFYLHALVDELLRDGVEPTERGSGHVAGLDPPAVTRAMTARLARLGDDATALAKAVAVLGDDARFEHAAGLAGLDPDAARQAATELGAAALMAGEERLSFAHPITRNAVYGDIPRPERAGLHRDAVRLLESANAPPERRVPHLLALAPAGDPKVVATLRAAASAAAARGAVDAAVTGLRRAVEEPPGEGQQAEVLRELGEAELRIMSPEGIPRLRTALELAAGADERASIARQLAQGLMYAGLQPDAVELMREELERATGNDDETRLSLEAEFVTVALWGVDGPIAKIDQILERSGREEDPGTSAGRSLMAAKAVRMVQRAEHAPEVVALASDALVRGIAKDGPGSTAAITAFGALMGCAAHDVIRDLASEGLHRARAAGDVTSAAACSILVAWAATRQGDIEEAAPLAADALRLVREHSIVVGHPVAMARRVDVQVARGEPDQAWEELRRDRFDGPLPPQFTSAYLLEARGRLRALEGDHEAALNDLLACGEHARRWGAVGAGLWTWRPAAIDSLLALGRGEEARELATVDLEQATRFGAKRLIGLAQRAVALTGPAEDMPEALATAAGTLEEAGDRLEQARALIDLGAALRRQGRRVNAREPLGQGLELARGCGTVPLVERAYTELRATGARPRKVLRTGVDALTPSELRVARMAAEELTNREIAQQLFVTTKTVEFHLTQAYRKLEIDSRAELDRALGTSS